MSSILNISNLSSLLFENPIYRNEKARFLFVALGAGLLLSKTFVTARCWINSLFACQKDLAERYGKGSWVVVTGASEGIGKAFCAQFARRGFNIVLIARNPEKTEQVAAEIKAQYPLVQTKTVIADFSFCWEEGFGEKILDAVADLDISVVVNNVGQLFIDHYTELPVNNVRDQVIVNCLSQALITRIFLPKMVERKNRSAVISMSSLGSQYPRPYFQLYSASKAFNDFLSRGISEEYPNIDILSLKPGFVATKMTSNKKIDLQTVTTDDFVNNSLKYLGSSTSTFGHWKHRYNAFQISLMPKWFRTKYITRRFNRAKSGFSK